MKYKSKARISKTFYGITINPGETKEFPGYINDRNLTPVKDNTTAKKKVVAKQSKVSSTPTKAAEVVKTASNETVAKTTSTATVKKTSDDAVTKSGGES